MKATFPVRSFPWAHYAPAALFCVAATVASVLVYDGLPERLATNFGADGRPVGWMTKESYAALMFGTVWGVLVFLLALDRFLVHRSFPAPILSAVTGAIELSYLSIHLGIIEAYDLEGLSPPAFVALSLGPFIAYLVVHCLVARTRAEDEPTDPPLWVDCPPHSLLDTVLFFVRPFLPGEVRAYEEGLVLKAWLYTFAVPWETIESITHATAWEALGGMAARAASNPWRAVKLKLSGTKLPLIFSIEDEARLVAEWEKRRAKPSE